MRRFLLAATIFATFTTTPATAAVPSHGRAWELVTPPEPLSARMFAVRAISQAGDRVSYLTLGSLPDAPYGNLITSNVAVRGPGGWENTGVGAPSPETAVFGSASPVVFSPDLTTSVWKNALKSEAEGPVDDAGLFLTQPAGGYTLLLEIGSSGELVDATEDLQRIVFRSEAHLLAADAVRSEGESLYELAGSTLSLVDVSDDGSLLSPCGVSPPGPEGVSRDGLRVFFAARPGCTGSQRAYLRAGGDTTEISASQCTLPDCGSAADVYFAGATPSGSSAFLVTSEQLTDDDLEPASDLYRFDVASGDLTLLTPRPPGVPPGGVEPARFRVSADGSRAYFLAYGQLLPDKGAEGFPAYYLADAEGLHFVAPADAGEAFEISDDGRYALFSTLAPLAPDDTDTNADAYRFDAVTSAYTRVSAGIGGGGNEPVDVSIPQNKTTPSHPYRALVGDGRRAFFTTAEQLVPEDVNDKDDVYEWADGTLGLVSGGLAGHGAGYEGMSTDGSTVVIRTTASLLARDQDGGDVDFYAARIGGGFTEPTPSCEVEPCLATAKKQSAARRPMAGIVAGPPRIGLAPIGPGALRQLARRGWTTLLAEVPAPGHLAASGVARIGPRRRTVASGSAAAEQAGPVRLRLELTKAAREILARGGRLRVRLALRQAGPAPSRTTSFTLGGER